MSFWKELSCVDCKIYFRIVNKEELNVPLLFGCGRFSELDESIVITILPSIRATQHQHQIANHIGHVRLFKKKRENVHI